MDNPKYSLLKDIARKLKSSIVIKSSGWYVVADFVNKGVAFLLTPFLTRLLTTDDYGDFSNFAAWSSILLVITSLDMSSSIVRGRFDYKDHFDEYVSSIVGATFISTSAFSCIILIFRDYFSDLFGFEGKYLYALILYLFFKPATNYFIVQQSAILKYKSSAIVSLSSSVLTIACSLGLVIISDEKLWARTIGYIIIPILYGTVLYFELFQKGRKIKFDAIVYALRLSIPLIPHNLSNGLLGQSDRTIIKKYLSSHYVALYSVGYNIGTIVYIATQAVSYGVTPWLYTHIERGDYKRISKVHRLLALGGGLFSSLVVMLSPELLYLFGGNKYMDTLDIIPVVVVGVYYQYLSKLYINIEFYMKKTYMISIASCLAAITNVFLNVLFVPRYGFVAAAWTTMVSYLMVLIINGINVFRSEFRVLINYWEIAIMSVGFALLIPVAFVLYQKMIMRYMCLIFMMVFGVILLIKKLKSQMS